MSSFLDFEKPVADLMARIADLRESSESNGADMEQDIARLEAKADKLLAETYAKLTPWQKTKVARHPDRPHFKHFVARLFEDFIPLAGDRAFGEDLAIIGGFARFAGQPVVVIGHEKGDDTASRLRHNFGMGKPEGYRKAIRLMELADRFGLPVITLVDTSGAFPGVQGGSGGAVALATGNRVLMYEHAVYSVISPEGCASILWRSSDKAADAADAMRITAQDLVKLGVIDTVVAEPVGGAHRSPDAAIDLLAAAMKVALAELSGLDSAALRSDRRRKFLAMGAL
jgi:acetyl-CoA carboxylase carboxyl transferase subunit alpha